MKKWNFIFIFLLFNAVTYAQLPSFNLNVSAVDETCSGNGALNMTVSNTTAGATITYTLYLLPDTTNPVAQTSNNFFNSLQAGDYNVVATQSLNNEESSEQQNITIADLTTTLDYDISHTTTSDCDVYGTITVNILSGNPVSFEILSGPEIVPPQTSNVFSDLQAGTYVIRVFDDCDNAVSKTYTLILDINDISISNVNLPILYDNCNEVEITNTLSPAEGTSIIFPLTLTYTVFPPDGSASIVFTQNITSESSTGFNASQIVPLFGADNFLVNLTITDSCNQVFELDQTIQPNPKVKLITTEAFCGEFLNLTVQNYLPPFTVSFLSAPAEFNPIDYNENFPGPYTDGTVTFGVDDNPVPTGLYTVEVVDACGRIGSFSISVDQVEVEPVVNTSNSGCDANSGFLEVRIPDREIVAATIISAPSSFNQTLPYNANAFITGDILSIQDNNLPAGTYILTVIDNCGVEYTIEESIPNFVFQDIEVVTLPNCESSTGSISLSSPQGNLVSISIISAPSTFTETLPYDLTSTIDANGNLFINNVPIGSYVFESTDSCNFQYTTNVNVNSYSSNPFAYTLTRNCGSFNVTINDFDESVTNQTYWLQLYFEDTDTWGHPNTGAVYTEGQIPNTTTAIQIENFETLYNIFLTGDFRLIKVFQSLNTENPETYCLDVFANFTIFSDLVIAGVYNLNCEGSTNGSDVVIDVIGVAPYNFSILSPIVLDNGTDNTFTGLLPGTYEIKVEDACGSIENTIVNLENLLPLVRANQPENMTVCRDDGETTDLFLLDNQMAQILGNQNSNYYSVSYHLSQADADTGNNPLSNQYTNISNPQTIYARVIHNNLDLCHATTSFQIYVGQVPELSSAQTHFICPETTVTLTADSGFDTYLWSTGETTSAITVAEAGTYTVAISDTFLDFSCESIKEFVVIPSEVATIDSIEISDWTANNNTITVMVSGLGDYVFSLDAFNFQEENTFTNLPPGEYTVYIKDTNGCGVVEEQVFLLNYPSFFTPNGDDINEVWQIKFSKFEPELKVVIFDRYGKLLTQFGSQDIGWDGTYNGHNMPANDYWFLVTRANGLQYKGHFTLKR